MNMEPYILTPDFERDYIVDHYESLLWVERYNSAGDFELYTPASPSLISRLPLDSYLQLPGSNKVMIVEDRAITNDVETGDHFIFSGRSLESILDRRIIWQQTIINGNLQQGVQKLLNENAIAPTDASRRISRLRFKASTDPAVTGLTLEAQFTGASLYEAIVAICEPYNLGFRITLTEDQQFEFNLYAGVDRSYDQLTNEYVVFSPKFDNIVSNDYSESKQLYRTITLVAGEGEGLERTTTTVSIAGGAGTDLERREMYTDARDISSNNGEIPAAEYLKLLAQRGDEYLSVNALEKSFSGQVDATRRFEYGSKFFMGDILQIETAYGIKAKTRVVEFIRSQDVNGLESYPTFVILE